MTDITVCAETQSDTKVTAQVEIAESAGENGGKDSETEAARDAAKDAPGTGDENSFICVAVLGAAGLMGIGAGLYKKWKGNSYAQ